MMKFYRLSALFMLALSTLAACGGNKEPAAAGAAMDSGGNTNQSLSRTPSPNGAAVFFITPANGDVLPTTFTLRFGVEGMVVVPAGDNAPNSGHHHLLIDTELPDLNLPVPADANHVHFGDGSTSTERTLPPGEHTLQLLFADYLHVPHDPPVYSDRITITVE